MVREWYENEKTELQREKKRLTNNTQVKEEREDKLGHTNEKGPPRHLQCHLDWKQKEREKQGTWKQRSRIKEEAKIFCEEEKEDDNKETELKKKKKHFCDSRNRIDIYGNTQVKEEEEKKDENKETELKKKKTCFHKEKEKEDENEETELQKKKKCFCNNKNKIDIYGDIQVKEEEEKDN